MVRALDYNGTLERREFEPRLRIFAFFAFFLFLTTLVYNYNNVEKINESNIVNLFYYFR